VTHVVELNEWDRTTVSVDLPTRHDLAVISQLQEEHDRKVELTWTKSGQLQVRSFSWVGVIRLHACTINIRPKYAGNELGVLKMLEYAGGYRALHDIGSNRSLPPQGADLLDLLCHLLSVEATALLRDGLIHDYTTEEEALTILRGSLRFREQATRRFGQLDALECRFDDFHADVIENRLVRTGLLAARRFCSNRDVRRRLQRLEHALADLCEPGPTDAGYYRQRLVYGRRNERYRRAHEYALLLLDRLGIDDLYATSTVESFSFLIDMNAVFESLMAAVLDEAFRHTPWHVTSQHRIRTAIIDRVSGRRYSTIIPDLVLSAAHTQIPFDCKYKLYGTTRKLAPSDIYQAFLYAYTLAGNGHAPRAGLIYPARHTTTTPHLAIRRVDGPVAAELTGIAVDLIALQAALDDGAAWDQMLATLRGTVSSVLESETE
jgi:5-methylcytosine-specific restriction enzyme subunit McrC